MNNITGIFGSAGNNTFLGGDLAEIVEGRGGNDTLNGGKGADVLDGGTGTNTLIGGSGADIYDFKDEDATTTINDFSRTDGDKICIASTIASSFSDLTITNNGTSSRVTVGDLEIIVNGSQTLTASDFELTDDGAGSGGDDGDSGGVSYNVVHGGSGNDYLPGTDGPDMIFGHEGDDIIVGGMTQTCCSAAMETTSSTSGRAWMKPQVASERTPFFRRGLVGSHNPGLFCRGR